MPTLDVVDLDNKKVGSVSLDDQVFAAKPRRHVLTEVVHWQRAKRRRGTQAAMTKGQVAGTTKKPYGQKGTGNARQGDWKSPHHEGGGVAFAPKPRDYSYAMPKAKRRVALSVALSLKVKEGGIRVVKDFAMSEFKTKAVLTALSNLDADKALIVDGDNEHLKKSARNIQNAKYLHHAGLNVYDLLRYPRLVITESAAKAVQARLLGEGSDA